MSDDVPRLRDAGSEASAVLRKLLQSAERDVPSDGELARLATRLAPVLGGAVATGSAVAPAASVLKSGLVGKLAAIAGVVTAAGFGVAISMSSGEPIHTIGRPARATRPLLTVPAAPVAPPAPTGATEITTPAPEPPAEPHATANKAPRSGAPSETQLLQQAQAALKTDPARALALAQAHQRRFPSGALAQEREVIAIEAMRRLGRSSDAERRAREFREDNPDSAHIPRIERSKNQP